MVIKVMIAIVSLDRSVTALPEQLDRHALIAAVQSPQGVHEVEQVGRELRFKHLVDVVVVQPQGEPERLSLVDIGSVRLQRLDQCQRRNPCFLNRNVFNVNHG